MSEAPDDIEFFFDIGSPYSYLASTQLDALEQQTGAAVTWRPFLLGGVFKETGNRAPAEVQAKSKYMLRDLQRWAEHYGVPFQLSPHFPVNTLHPQRALVAAGREDRNRLEELATELFRRCWVEGDDVSTPEVVASAADAVGYDGESIVDRTQDPQVKSELRAISDEAVERGAFGAPTFFVGDAMFWGNDRLEFVRRAVQDEDAPD